MKTYFTIQALVVSESGKYLVTKRAKGRDSGSRRPVTGYDKEHEAAEDAAIREVHEEVGVRGKLLKSASPFWLDYEDKRYLNVSSLVGIDDNAKIKLDKREASDYKWIDKDDPLVGKSYVLKRTMQELGII